MAACPPHHQYGSPFLNPHNSSILFNDMIHTAFQHLGGLPTSDNISPQSWECCHYSPPIMATQDSPCSLDNSAITDAFFGSDQRITALDAASVHLQQEGVIENHICTDKKRKDSKVGKRKKQEKCSSGKVEKKDNGEAPIGYVRVRARRGQATDNHSLAERVRREKINARMRKLQRLVPGCDKVTGRAPMLDEIINYVQSLQNQVEFLSMKLAASAHPMQDDFTLISDHYIFHDQELDDMSPPAVQSFPRYSAIQRTAVAVPENHCPILDTSLPLFLRHQQDGPVAFHQDGSALPRNITRWTRHGRGPFFHVSDNFGGSSHHMLEGIGAGDQKVHHVSWDPTY